MEGLSSSLRCAVFVVKSGPTHHFLSLQLPACKGTSYNLHIRPRARPTRAAGDTVLLGSRSENWWWSFFALWRSRGQEGKSKWYSFSLRASVRSGISSQSSNLLHCPGLHTLKGHPKWVFPLVVSYINSCCVDFYFKVSFWWSEPKTGVILSKGSCPLNSPALSPPPIRRLHCPALVLCGRVLIWSSRGRWNITFIAN